MLVCLQKHYKMQAVACLNISVSAAFCAANCFLINIVQDSLGYDFIPAWRQARSKQAARRGFHQCFATWHLCNTGPHTRIATGLLLMQLIGLTGQCNISLFIVFLWLIVVKSLIKGDNFGDPKCFREERRVVEESTLLTTALQPQPVQKSCCSVQDRLAVPIQRKSIVLA